MNALMLKEVELERPGFPCFSHQCYLRAFSLTHARSQALVTTLWMVPIAGHLD